MTETSALTVRRLSKTFGATRALKDVSISFRKGAITALLGANGCGKSTLIKVLAGFHAPDGTHHTVDLHGLQLDLDDHGLHLQHHGAGADHGPQIEIDGESIAIPVDPAAVYARGLRFVHQDLALIDDMSVSDNLALVHAFAGTPTLGAVRPRTVRERTKAQLAIFGLDIDPDVRVGSLSRTDQIMIAIARAFHGGGRIAILDEPTASLPAGSVDQVLNAVRRIRSEGGTVLYVTHRIDEVLRIADDVVVLRDGRVAVERPLGDLDGVGLARLIAGATVRRPPMEQAISAGQAVLETRGLCATRLRDIHLTLRSGEILGVAGLAGCGRSELARVLGGAQRPTAGEILLEGRPVTIAAPRDAIEAGVVFVPPERKRFGCIGDLSVRHNVTLSGLSPWWHRGVLQQRKERRSVAHLLDEFDVRPRDTERRIEFLSGGNQQRTLMAKFARLRPKVMVVDEPTQGVDISGKQGIADLIRRAAAGGSGIIIASSDFDEIADLCDRVLVLDRGRMLGVFERGTIHEEQLSVLGERERIVEVTV